MHGRTHRNLSQRNSNQRLKGAVGGRDRVATRAELRVAQKYRQGFRHFRRGGMLQSAGQLIQPGPLDLQVLIQKAFPQALAAQHITGSGLPGLRQRYAFIRSMRDQPLVGQAVHHLVSRDVCHTQPPGQPPNGHYISLAQFHHRLEIHLGALA